MKKTITIIIATVVLCTAMIIGSVSASAVTRSKFYTHFGCYDENTSSLEMAVQRTLGMVRMFYDSYDFSSDCYFGVGYYNNEVIFDDCLTCDGCRAARAGELLPVPAEAPEE